MLEEMSLVLMKNGIKYINVSYNNNNKENVDLISIPAIKLEL